jgi:hypothetical protein
MKLAFEPRDDADIAVSAFEPQRRRGETFAGSHDINVYDYDHQTSLSGNSSMTLGSNSEGAWNIRSDLTEIVKNVLFDL